VDDIIFPEKNVNATPDEMRAWRCEMAVILSEMLERSLIMEQAAKEKAAAKKK
jgi:hypothetical protein